MVLPRAPAKHRRKMLMIMIKMVNNEFFIHYIGDSCGGSRERKIGKEFGG